jgi:ribonuclease E
LGFVDGENSAGKASADQQAPADDSNASGAPRNENGEPREKRSRDRYGRERSPRGEREDRPDLRIPVQPVAAQVNEGETTAIESPVPAPLPRAADVAATAALQVARPVSPSASVPGPRMPKVTSFALPTEALLDVALGSGLQWVNSDSAKVAAVQAAIAAEPQPIHVPRERPPAVSIDIGPLVLVETKRDLRNMTLPFEQSPSA